MKLKTEKYKGFEIIHEVSSRGLFSSYVDGIGSAPGPAGINHEWESLDDSTSAIKARIDGFLSKSPKNYKELSEEIEATLVWTGYEDCHIDPKVLQPLVESFIAATHQKKGKL